MKEIILPLGRITYFERKEEGKRGLLPIILTLKQYGQLVKYLKSFPPCNTPIKAQE
jgi:hypothetical protein